LQKSEFYLAEAQRLGQMGNWVFDPAVGFDHWSRELFRIHGLDPAAGTPSSEKYLALVDPQDREFMTSLVKQMTHEVSGFDVTKRVVRPQGDVRYIRCVGTPVLDKGRMKKIGRASRIATVAELSASIAHELNQPLMAVLGNAQAAKRWLAASPPDLTETNASLERVLRAIRSADETMQRIRALFKRESFEKTEANVPDMIREGCSFSA
jgi:signal transduction histidine kinase